MQKNNSLVIAERVDISEVSFELPDDMDNFDGLFFFEQQLLIAHQDIIDSETRFAYHLYMILNHELFRHVIEKAEEVIPVVDPNQPSVFQTAFAPTYKSRTKVTDTRTGREVTDYVLRDDIIFLRGNPNIFEIKVEYEYRAFPNQQVYLDHLDRLHSRGKSTMKRDYGALKMATFLGYTQPKQIAEKGIQVLADVFGGLVTDRETGRPIKLKSGQVPEGQNVTEYAKYAINELAMGKEVLSRSDYAARRDHLLKPSSPRVGMEVRDDGGRHWYYEKYQNETLIYLTGEIVVEGGLHGLSITFEPSQQTKTIPDEVLDYIYTKVL